MPSRRRSNTSWAALSDERLLDLRPCDLNLRVEGSDLEPAVDQLQQELGDRDIPVRPHVWLSDEWFTPDGVPGIAAPFFLAHPRLRELERSQMLEVEGGTHDWCMRILRHEAGHALDNAYRLHRRTRYRELFGSWHDPYPDSYRPKPDTKHFVIHLDLWYAQAHPAEDFAETFAVWLNPASAWQQQYADWPALRKLQYVDGLMYRCAGSPPAVLSRRRTHTLSTLRRPLREYYEARRRNQSRRGPGVYDRDLRRIFRDTHAGSDRGRSATGYVESVRDDLREMVSRWTGAPSLTIDRTIADMITRIRLLGLRLGKPTALARTDLMMMLAVQTMNFVHGGKHRVVL